MISNQVIQNTLTEIADITNVNAAVCDASGKLIGSRGETAPIDDKLIGSFAHSQSPEQETADLLLGRISDDGETAFVAVVDKGAPNAAMALKLIVTQTENLVQAYKEKLDKDSFIKNLLLDNLLQIDIFNRAKKLHIEFKQPRAVFIVETKGQETPVNEILHQTFAGQTGEFVTGIDEDIQVVVHEVRGTAPHDEELKDMADQIYGVLKGAGISCRVSYGAVVDELKDVSKSYKEARLAHDVGLIFYEDSDVVAYSNLGIGRLIYQLPINLCRMFISEIFGNRSMDEFDDETLATINKFFENNLNVSETSRQLFIHRNTLVYRLDKLQKTTGLDLRVFDDAITFKIALMVVKYMDYMDRIEY